MGVFVKANYGSLTKFPLIFADKCAIMRITKIFFREDFYHG